MARRTFARSIVLNVSKSERAWLESGAMFKGG